MALTKKDQRELDQLYSDFGDTYGGVKQDYFALLYLTRKFKCDVSSVAHQVAFGGNDFGIDAYYMDRDARNLYLFQFKWSEDHNSFKESVDRLTQDGMETIFGNPLQNPARNEYLQYLKADIRECASLVQRVYIQFVFKGEVEAAEKSAGLADRLENLQNKRHFLEHAFEGRQVELIPEFVADFRSPSPPSMQDSFEVAWNETASLQMGNAGQAMYVGFISLMDLNVIHHTIGQRFLDRNIRAGLSADNPPNRKIREALADIVVKQSVEPEVFAFNHNGITLAAERVDFEDRRATIRSPRLLNGAQTITSVTKFLKDNESAMAQAPCKSAFSRIKVLAKLVVGDPHSDFITNVTICNNRQNPVDPWNLRANDKIQCDLHDKFKEEMGIFYSRQENAFLNYSDDELLEMGIEDSRDIKIKPLAQTFCAIQGEIDRLTRLGDLFENQKSYQETFRDSYLKSDARKIVLCYKISLVINSPMQRIEEKAPAKLVHIMTKAKNLVWALLVQGLLNDKDLQGLLDRYGTRLAKEADFRELLKTMAGSKIVPILKDVLADENYQKKAEAGNFAFLRTREIYKRCIDIAYEKYLWTKKSI
jgi:hypothetical protein